MSQQAVVVLELHIFPGEEAGFLERGVQMYKVVGVCFANFISFLLNIP